MQFAGSVFQPSLKFHAHFLSLMHVCSRTCPAACDSSIALLVAFPIRQRAIPAGHVFTPLAHGMAPLVCFRLTPSLLLQDT